MLGIPIVNPMAAHELITDAWGGAPVINLFDLLSDSMIKFVIQIDGANGAP